MSPAAIAHANGPAGSGPARSKRRRCSRMTVDPPRRPLATSQPTQRIPPVTGTDQGMVGSRDRFRLRRGTPDPFRDRGDDDGEDEGPAHRPSGA